MHGSYDGWAYILAICPSLESESRNKARALSNFDLEDYTLDDFICVKLNVKGRFVVFAKNVERRHYCE